MSSASTALALYASTISTSQVTAAQPEEVGELSHHVKGGKGFLNPWESFQEFSVPVLMWSILSRKFSGTANSPDTAPPTVPVRQPMFTSTRQTSKLRATWLGHACYLVEFPSGLRVLFDPVFTHRCSPLSFAGPARFTPPPCDIADIPTIDAVVISHNHYDHLSYPTIMKIKERHPNVQFFAPLGNKKWFISCGIHNITELDWWQTKDLHLSRLESQPNEQGKDGDTIEDGVNGVQHEASDIVATIGCLPCQHVTARTPFDKCHTLWASWSVESGGKKVWFGGDTGYRAVPRLPDSEDDYAEKYDSLPRCPAFAQIGNLRGPFDLGLIPIGAYAPRFIFSSMHANPFDSVQIFRDTKCRNALGMHWGTWVLTEEDVMEPPRTLKEALRRNGLAEEGIFDVCDIGESREF